MMKTKRKSNEMAKKTIRVINQTDMEDIWMARLSLAIRLVAYLLALVATAKGSGVTSLVCP